MKRTYPLLLMLFFGLTALWTSVQSYRIAQHEITSDLTQALLMTQAEGPVDWLSTDTIRQFRSHIMRPELRADASLSFSVGDNNPMPSKLHTQALAVSSCIHAQGYVAYSAWQVLRMSDQRLSIFLSLLMLLCMAFSLRRMPRRTDLRLTPMQEQLVNLLMSSPNREMSKHDICQTLWPGKPDASETLYTLVRRTKQALEGEGRIRISSVRGRAYRIDM